MGNVMRKKDEVEISLLKRFGLRYAILAAWEGELLKKGYPVHPTIPKMLANVRVKISSGCFTACEVGCDLTKIEGNLFSCCTTPTNPSCETCDFWVNMLAECMEGNIPVEEIEKKIPFPSVKMHFNRFNFDGACGSCGHPGSVPD